MPEPTGGVSVTEAGEHVFVVEFANPPLNYFDVPLLDAIADAIVELADGGRCRAVVLASTGKHFCVGANLTNELTPGRHIYDAGVRIFDQPLPIVAAVQGSAIGGGLGLALSADFRVAAPSTRFIANFVQLGLHQGFGLTVTLPSVVGQQLASEMLLSARRVQGEEALAIGLCDRLVNEAELRSQATELASALATGAPLSLRSIRASLREDLVANVHRVLNEERLAQERLMKTSDFREGVRATRDRRTPRFEGS